MTYRIVALSEQGRRLILNFSPGSLDFLKKIVKVLPGETMADEEGFFHRIESAWVESMLEPVWFPI